MIIVHDFMDNLFNQNNNVVGIIIISEYFEIFYVIELIYSENNTKFMNNMFNENTML